MPARQSGILISHGCGDAEAYALYDLQARGEILVKPGEKLYEGTIIGVNNRRDRSCCKRLTWKELN